MIPLINSTFINDEEYFFRFSRSSGAGGQKVNKTNTRVELVWNLTMNSSLSRSQLASIRVSLRNYINKENQLIVSSERSRTQLMNKQDCLNKLGTLVRDAIKIPERRIPTRPGKNAKAKRVDQKKQNSDKKKNRKKVTDY